MRSLPSGASIPGCGERTSGAPKDEEVEKIVMHDGVESPTDVCDHYENEEELNALIAGAVETSQGA